MRIFKFLSILLLLTSCSDVGTNDIAGTYQCIYPYGNELLKLDANGSYKQVIQLSGMSAKTNSGSWRYDQNNVMLENAIIVDDGFGKSKSDPFKIEEGYRGLEARKSWGKIKLIENEDQGFYFEKK